MDQPSGTERDQVAAIIAADEVEREHQCGTLAWLDSTRDIYDGMPLPARDRTFHS